MVGKLVVAPVVGGQSSGEEKHTRLAVTLLPPPSPDVVGPPRFVAPHARPPFLASEEGAACPNASVVKRAVSV